MCKTSLKTKEPFQKARENLPIFAMDKPLPSPTITLSPLVNGLWIVKLLRSDMRWCVAPASRNQEVSPIVAEVAVIA